MNSPRCNAAQNTCTFSLIMCLKNLATNTLIPTGVATTARTRGSAYEPTSRGARLQKVTESWPSHGLPLLRGGVAEGCSGSGRLGNPHQQLSAPQVGGDFATHMDKGVGVGHQLGRLHQGGGCSRVRNRGGCDIEVGA